MQIKTDRGRWTAKSGRPPSFSAGFSMVELLVVIAIIALLAAIGIGAFRDGQSTAVSTAAATVSSAVSAARQLAVTKNCRTRFFIVTDSPSNPTWKLRRYGILRVPEDETDVDEDGNIEFELASRMDDLPIGVYFRDNLHSPGGAAASGSSMFDSPVSDRIGGENVRYAYIEFLPSGGTSQPSTSNIFEITRAPSADDDIPNNENYLHIGVAQSTGRVKFERPEL